jgi:hypothetical protein
LYEQFVAAQTVDCGGIVPTNLSNFEVSGPGWTAQGSLVQEIIPGVMASLKLDEFVITRAPDVTGAVSPDEEITVVCRARSDVFALVGPPAYISASVGGKFTDAPARVSSVSVNAQTTARSHNQTLLPSVGLGTFIPPPLDFERVVGLTPLLYPPGKADQLEMVFGFRSSEIGDAVAFAMTVKLDRTRETGGDPPISKKILVFPTSESASGQDLNGDGYLTDTVLRYLNLATGEVTNTGLSVSSVHGDIDLYEHIIAFVGGDGRVRYYDLKSSTVGETGLIGSHPTVYEDRIVFVSQGTIRVFDVNRKTAVDTGVPSFPYFAEAPVFYGDIVAFQMGKTIQYYDLRTGTVTDTGAVGTHPVIFGDRIAFVTSEAAVGSDLNGDGDVQDSVVRYYELASRVLRNTGAVGSFPAICGDRIVFSTPEESVNVDLNGDGLIWGDVIRYYDLSLGHVVNTQELGTEPDCYGDMISYYQWEFWTGIDLNGDGDQNDSLVFVKRFP